MKSSWRIARVAGISIQIHLTFPLLLVWIGLRHLHEGGSLQAAASDILLVLSLFVIVVLHELGHALTAARYGIRTRDITLLPIGGVAHLERIPDNPKEELWVALAGPAVNLALGAVLLGAIRLVSGEAAWSMANLIQGGFLEQLLFANLAMAVFNLIPAFPMDGGRILRALLSLRIDYLRATTVAARIGQVIAVAMAVAGIVSNPFLVVMALLVWMGAGEEARMIRLRSSLATIDAGAVSIPMFESFAPGTLVSDAAAVVLRSFQPVFPLLEDGRIAGMVGRGRILDAYAGSDSTACLCDLPAESFLTISALEKVGDVVAKLREAGRLAAPVVAGGQLIGLLTLESIFEHARLHRPVERPVSTHAAHKTRIFTPARVP